MNLCPKLSGPAELQLELLTKAITDTGHNIYYLQSMGCNRSKQKDADIEEVISDNEDTKEVFKSAENFLKNWSERRDSEKIKTANISQKKIHEEIVRDEEDSYVSFTIVKQFVIWLY